MKYILSLLTLFCFLNPAYSTEYLQGNLTEDILFKGTPVRVTPANKITTSKKNFKVGDNVKFVVVRDVLENDSVIIKRETPVYGQVLSITPNKSVGIPAKVVLGKFETSDILDETVPLKGEIKKEGNPHNTLISYLDFLAIFVRGGEVQLIPEEDTFIVFY